MEGVQAGHGEVEREENLRLFCCLLRGNFSDVWIAVLLGIAYFLSDITQALVRRAASAPSVETFSDHVAGNVAFVPLVVILLGFYTEESGPKNHCCNEQPDLRFALAVLRGPHRHRHGEAAGDQD